METLLNQPISLVSPASVIGTYLLVLFLFRKKITSFSVDKDKSFSESPGGRGILWTYALNPVLLWSFAKIMCTYDESTKNWIFDNAIGVCTASAVIFVLSPISIFFVLFLIVAAILATIAVYINVDQYRPNFTPVEWCKHFLEKIL